MIDTKKESPSQADPYVISLAMAESNKQKGQISGYTNPNEYVIVTEEHNLKRAGSSYGFSCIKIVEVFSLEGWQFK